MAKRSSVRFFKEHQIVEIVEKPEPGTAPSNVGANLTFVMPSSIMRYVEDVALSVRGEREIQQAVNSWLRQGGSARGVIQDTPLEWMKPEQ